MSRDEPVARVELTLSESGTLCYLLLHSLMRDGHPKKPAPQWLLDLHAKLCAANDRVKRKLP